MGSLTRSATPTPKEGLADLPFLGFVKALQEREPEKAQQLYDQVTEQLVIYLGLRLDEVEAAPMRHVWRYVEIVSKVFPCAPAATLEEHWDVNITNPQPEGKR